MRSQAVLPVLFACLVLVSCAPASTSGPSQGQLSAAGTPLAAAAASAEAFDLTATPLQPVPPTPTPWPTSTLTPIPSQRRLTGVLLGADWDPIHPERVTFGVRTDVFVVYIVDEAYGQVQVTLIALPRDLWVGIPPTGHCSGQTPGTHDRINSAWGVYGDVAGGGDPFGCVVDVVEWNLGLEVNAPIAYIELRGFVALIDRIGGITVTPTEDYTDFCGDILGTEGDGGEWRTWRAGREYSLRGNEALCYVRGRRVAIGDLDRNRRALEVLKAIRATVFETTGGYPEGLWTFVEFGRDYVDLGLRGPSPFAGGEENVVNLIWHLLPLALELQHAEIRTIRMGTDQTDFWTTPRGASVVVPTVNLRPWLVCVMATDNVKGCTADHPIPTRDLCILQLGGEACDQ